MMFINFFRKKMATKKETEKKKKERKKTKRKKKRNKNILLNIQRKRKYI